MFFVYFMIEEQTRGAIPRSPPTRGQDESATHQPPTLSLDNKRNNTSFRLPTSGIANFAVVCFAVNLKVICLKIEN